VAGQRKDCSLADVPTVRMPASDPYFPAPSKAPQNGGPFREASVPAPSPSPAAAQPAPLRARLASSATSKVPSEDAPLPVELDGDHVTETFGFGAGAVGSAGLVVALGMIVDSTTTYAWWHLPAAVLVGVLGMTYELVRRQRRLAFVAHGREHIGIYRKKRLACVARLDEMVRYRLRLLNTFRQLVAFGFPAVVGGLLFWLFITHGDRQSLTAILVSAGAMISGTLGFVATAWGRVFCIQFTVQHPQLGNEVVVLRRRDATKLNLTL